MSLASPDPRNLSVAYQHHNDDYNCNDEDENDGEDALLEHMLWRAERLVNEMKTNVSSRSSSDNNSDFSVPESIEMKPNDDTVTECSSVGGILQDAGTLTEEEVEEIYEEKQKQEHDIQKMATKLCHHTTSEQLPLTTEETKQLGHLELDPNLRPSLRQTDATVSSAIQAARQMEVDLEEALKTSTTFPNVEVKSNPVVDREDIDNLSFGKADSTSSCEAMLSAQPIAANTTHEENNAAESDLLDLQLCDTDHVDTNPVIQKLDKANSDTIETLQTNARSKDSVVFEKVTTANNGDQDYVPLHDYSGAFYNGEFQPDQQLQFAEQRIRIRQRRKKRRRRRVAAAILCMTVFMVAAIWYMILHRQNTKPAEVATNNFSVHKALQMEEPIKESNNDLISDLKLQDKESNSIDTEQCDMDAAYTDTVADIKGLPSTMLIQTRDSVTNQGQVIEMSLATSLPSNVELCSLPLIQLFSPKCRNDHVEMDISQAQAQRRKTVESLLASMMQ